MKLNPIFTPNPSHNLEDTYAHVRLEIILNYQLSTSRKPFQIWFFGFNFVPGTFLKHSGEWKILVTYPWNYVTCAHPYLGLNCLVSCCLNKNRIVLYANRQNEEEEQEEQLEHEGVEFLIRMSNGINGILVEETMDGLIFGCLLLLCFSNFFREIN